MAKRQARVPSTGASPHPPAQVGGIISFNANGSSSTASLSLAWTESALFISPTQSDSSSRIDSNPNTDGVLAVPAPLRGGLYTQPESTLRGGFRYLTLALAGGARDAVTLANVSLAITFQPGVADLRDYAGYFYAPDPKSRDRDLLTKIWYAGAYTAQTNIISAAQGRQTISGIGPCSSPFVAGVLSCGFRLGEQWDDRFREPGHGGRCKA